MLRTVVASNIENDEISVEIWCDHDMVGEIQKIEGNLVINLYNCASSNYWKLNLVEFSRVFSIALEEARTI